MIFHHIFQGRDKIISRLDHPCECGGVYELVFMDVDMPLMNGIQATESIMQYCNQQKMKKPMVVAQTAFVDLVT